MEKLKDNQNAYGFELIQDQGEIMEWQVSFGNQKFKDESPYAPHAICLAALKAVGVEV